MKKIYLETNLQIIFSVTLVAVLGVASLTPAFPVIIQKFNISSQSIGLLITVFTLPGVVLTPFLGILADRLGRKKILIPSLFLFGIAGGLCALCTDYYSLLLMRIVQGIGAASLGSLNATLIGDIYQGRQRAAAMGYNASVLSIGTASYPAIGGALALLGWNYPFLLSLLAIPIGLVVIIYLNNPEPKEESNFNQYIKNAIQSINNKRVWILFIAGIVTFIILYGSCLTYYPILIFDNFKKSTLTIGIFMSCMSITTAITSSQIGKLVKKYSEIKLIKFAFFLYALSMLLIPFIKNLYLLLLPTILFGMAMGLNMPSIQTLLAGLAPIEHRAVFMSINGMVLRIGQTLGPIIIGLFYISLGLNSTFFAGTGFAVLIIIILIKWDRE